jgi:hypothetical protein
MTAMTSVRVGLLLFAAAVFGLEALGIVGKDLKAAGLCLLSLGLAI